MLPILKIQVMSFPLMYFFPGLLGPTQAMQLNEPSKLHHNDIGARPDTDSYRFRYSIRCSRDFTLERPVGPVVHPFVSGRRYPQISQQRSHKLDKDRFVTHIGAPKT